MLNKCANPDCAAKFRYLREGRLFEFAVGTRGHECLEGAIPGKASRREMFWLCGECSQTMSLECSEDGEVALVPRRKESAA